MHISVSVPHVSCQLDNNVLSFIVFAQIYRVYIFLRNGLLVKGPHVKVIPIWVFEWKIPWSETLWQIICWLLTELAGIQHWT